MNRLFDKWLVIGLGAVVALMVINAGVAYRNTRQLHYDAYWVAHTHEVLDALDDLLYTLADAETGERGFLISGEQNYLKPYDVAVATIDAKLARIKELTEDNAQQQLEIPKLQELVRAKMDELARTVALRRDAGFEAAQKEVLTHLGMSRMNAVRDLVAEMKDEEQQLLRNRQKTNDLAYRNSWSGGLLGTLIGLAAVGGFIWILYRHLQARLDAAAVVHEHREWLRTTLSSIGDAVIATDTAGRVTFLNAVAQGLTGWKDQQARNEPLVNVFRIVNEESRKPVESPALRALAEGVIVGLANHTTLISRHGTETPIDDSAAPIRDEQGHIIGVVLVFRDVTERRAAEADLKKNQEIFQLVHRIGKIGYWEWNALTDENQWSPEIEALYGLPPGGFEGGYQGWAKLVHPDDRARAEADVKQARQTGTYFTEFRVIWPDGSVHWLETRAKLFNDSQGRPVRMIGVNMDITERKRQEETLRASEREANRHKDEFLATLAHELRNPLAAIRNSVELLQRADGNDQVIEQSRSIMERQIAQMVRLVDDLLDISRITQGKIQLRKERVQLAAVIQSAVESTRPQLEALRHELIVTLPPEPVPLDADPTRLAQIFANLLDNAAKYSEKGSRIWLTAERHSGHVVVTVRDTGIGIAAEHLPCVFEMFSQAAPALERSQGGLGIGLALVKGLVELHGGTIEARSNGIGQGSEFIVSLPVVEIQAEMTQAPTNNKNGKVRPCRILFVDDNQDTAETMAMLLQMMGHEVRTALDGHEAVQAAEDYRPDVVLMDIGLPGMNGYEAARHIREQPWGKEMALVALTGWGQDEDKRHASEVGFDHHLTKPVGAAALEKLLASINPAQDRP